MLLSFTSFNRRKKGLSRSSSPSGSKKKVVFDDQPNETEYLKPNSNEKQEADYDSIDALPHLDHYRNIFSFTSSEPKTRPTLEALHGTANLPMRFKLASTIDLNSEAVSSMMIPNDPSSHGDREVKPKVEIVKFGWIIGVLVCLISFVIQEDN